MNGDQALQLTAAILCLVLVGSGLIARRIPLASTFKMSAAWVAIFAIALLALSFRDDLSSRFRSVLDPESGTVRGESLRVPLGDDGHFWVRGRVNGVETRFLIDSGATTTALSARTVAAAGIDSSRDKFGTIINTANGRISARRVRIADLAVGPIARQDIGAITADEFGDTNILGMNFLSSLSGYSVRDGTLEMTP